MKEIEVTVQIDTTPARATEIIEKQGFSIESTGRIEDVYLTQHKSELTRENLGDILNKSVLLRCINENGILIKKITHKQKTYDDRNMVVSEQKTEFKCDNLGSALKLFEILRFETLVEVKYNYRVYRRGDFSFALQEVERIGLVAEYESKKDFSKASLEEIIAEKEIMANELRAILPCGDNFDIKKAQTLILRDLKNRN